MEQALQTYIDKILESEEYRAYVVQRDKLKDYPELKKQIDEYRARNYEMQTSKEMVFEKIEAFEREYMDFRDNPLVSDFLAAELAFCRMMQRHNSRIMDAIEFE